MFKKLKDKIAEQSPLKLPTSVQQFAQAVVSSTSSAVPEPVTLTQQLPADPFSIGDELDDTPQNSPARRVQPELQNIDLHDMPTSPSNSSMLRDMSMSPASMYASPLPSLQFSGTRSRRSSIGSTTSDAGSIFSLLDAPVSPPFHLQSDWESAASEEGSSAVLETVSKEQLLGAYRRTQARYHKYKGRFNDLAKYYKQMERDLTKTRNVLASSQDKALRRISELKEQCQLEQTAKAHLEEALRNDLEEKDHKLKALQTKLEFLKSGSKPEEIDSSTAHNSYAKASEVNGEQEEVQALRDKVAALEAKQLKFRDALLQYKNRVEGLVAEKSQIEQERDATKNELAMLSEQASNLRRHQEEAALSLAENKQQIHVELEAREMEVQRLQASLTTLASEKDQLAHKTKDLQKGKNNATQTQPSMEHNLQELQTKLTEAERLLSEQMEYRKNTELELQKKHRELERACSEISEMKIKMQEGVTKLQEFEATVTKYQNMEHQVLETQTLLQVKEEELKSTQAELQELNTVTKNNDETTIKNLESDIVQQRQEIQRLNEELQNYNVNKENLIAQQKTLQENIEQLKLFNQNVSKEHKKIVESLNKRNDDLNNELLQTANKYSEVSNECEKSHNLLQKQATNFTCEKNELESRANELLDKLKTLKQEKDYDQNKIEELCKELQESNNKYQNLAEEKSEMESKYETRIREIQDSCHQTEGSFTEQNSIVQKLEDEKEKLSSIVKQFENEITQLKTELTDKNNSNESLTLEVQSLLDSVLLIGDETIQLSEIDIEQKWQLVTQKVHEMSIQTCALLEEKDTWIKNCEDNNESLMKLNKQLNDAISDKENLNKEIDKLENMEMISKQNIEENNSKLQAIQLELDEVKNEKSEAKKSLEEFILVDQQRQNEIEHLKSELQTLMSYNENLKLNQSNDIEEMQNKNVKLEKKVIELEYINTNLQTDLENNNYETQKRLQTELDKIAELKEQIITAEKCVSVSNNRIQELENEVGTLKEECERTQSLHNTNCNLEEQNSKIVDELEVQRNGNKQLVEKLKEARKILKTSKQELEKSKAEKSELELSVQNDKAKINELVESLQESYSQTIARDGKVKDYEESIEAMKSEFNEAKIMHQKELTEINNQLEVTKSQCEIANTKLQESEIKCDSLKKEIKKLTSNFESQINELHTQVQSFKSKYENNCKFAQELEDKCAAVTKELETCYLKHESQIKEISKEAEEDRNKHEEIMLQITERNTELEIRTRELEEMQIQQENTALQDIETNASELKTLHQREMNTFKEGYETEIKRLEKVVEDCKAAHDLILTNATQECRGEIDHLRSKVKELEEIDTGALLKSIEDKDVLLNEMNDKIKEMEDNYKTTIDKYQNEVFTLMQEQVQSESKLSDVEGQLVKSEALLLQADNKEIDEVNQLQRHHEASLTEANEKYETALREKLENMDDQHNMQLKLVVKDYENQLAKMAELHQQEIDERAEREERIENSAARQLREQSHELLQETRDTEAALERQISELKSAVKKAEDSERDIRLKAEEDARRVEQQIEEAKRQARSTLQTELAAAEAKHKEHMEAMIKEWQFERKSQNDITTEKKELEKTSQLAVAAMESSSGTVELLQRQLMAQAIAHRQSIVAQENTSQELDPALELAYLRNVLYEYMMGKQPLVLAKVIAAVARFDADQTQNVIHKEEQKQSLLGQFGII